MTTALTTQNFLGWIEQNRPKDVLRLSGHMQYGEQIKYVTVSVDPKKYPTLELVHLTDTQFGHVCCNVKRLIEYRDWILSEPNRFVLFGGDMVDAATQFSIASPYENEWKPAEQSWRLAEILLPLRHRVLAYVGGNHERRTDRTFGSLGLYIAQLLSIPYSEGAQFVDIHYGSWKPFKVSLWHGGGSAKTKGAKAQMLERFMLQGDSHLYLVGHLHDCLVLPSWRQVRDTKTNRVKLEKICGAMSSSFLDFWGTYAEVAGLRPSDTMMVRTILEPSGHFEVTLK